MHLIVKEGKEHFFNYHIGKDDIIINLNFRWPSSVSYSKQSNRLTFIGTGTEKVVIAFSNIIDLDMPSMTINKDQIIINYKAD